jgi:biotin carboxyl carrier protein
MVKDKKLRELQADVQGANCELILDGRFFSFEVLDALQKETLKSAGRKSRKHPEKIIVDMPGVVVDVLVEVGQEIAAGDVLAVVEAMKMQNEITAPAAARVEKILVAKEAVLASGETLFILDYQDVSRNI